MHITALLKAKQQLVRGGSSLAEGIRAVTVEDAKSALSTTKQRLVKAGTSLAEDLREGMAREGLAALLKNKKLLMGAGGLLAASVLAVAVVSSLTGGGKDSAYALKKLDQDLQPAAYVLVKNGISPDLTKAYLENSITDKQGDFIFSISDKKPGDPGAEVDIKHFNRVAPTPEDIFAPSADGTFSATVELHMGQNEITIQAVDLVGNPSEHTVTIKKPVTITKAIPVTITTAVMDDNIPTQSTDGRERIYAAVFDSDNSPANNWVPQGAYDWDFYQGTDRWYEVIGHTDGIWELKVTQSSGSGHVQQVLTQAYAVIAGNAVVFVIPTIEVSPDAGYRVTAFRHDGSYNLEHSAGDVSGTNPKSALSVLMVNQAPTNKDSSPGLSIPTKRSNTKTLEIPAGPPR